MLKVWFSVILFGLSFSVFASKPTCSSASGGYCQYVGKVNKIYINSSGVILMYFDTLASRDEAAAAGFNITQVNAAALPLNENPEFAKLFYSTALTAQASDREVLVQMHGVSGAYLKLDRIWLAE